MKQNKVGSDQLASYSQGFFFIPTIQVFFWPIFTLKNLHTGTVQSLCGGCSRRVHKIVYLAVKKGNILASTLRLKIFFTNYCHINPAMYLLNKIYMS